MGNKVYEILKQNIDANKEKGIYYTSIKLDTISKELNIDKNEVFNKVGDLCKEGKIFYHKEIKEEFKENGNKYTVDKIRYFDDKEKLNDFNKKLKEKENEKKLFENSKLEKITDNAKKVFNILKDTLKENNKVFIESSKLYENVLNKEKMKFEIFKDSRKELIENRLIYSAKIEKDNDVKYVVIQDINVLNKLLSKNKEKAVEEKVEELKAEDNKVKKLSKWNKKNKEDLER